MVKLSVISQREVEDTLQDFEKRRSLDSFSPSGAKES